MNWFITIFLSIILVSCSVAKEDKSFSNAIRLFLELMRLQKLSSYLSKDNLKMQKAR